MSAPVVAKAQIVLQRNGSGKLCQVLVRDLRRVTSRLDRNPAGYATGRTHTEEFSPNEAKK